MPQTFSILHRIEFAATDIWESIKSAVKSSFSILHRIEFAATKLLGGWVEEVGDLSVSSIGSSSLQQVSPLYTTIERNPFSILHRIEFAATGKRTIITTEVKRFQYPPSDRVRCNELFPRSP